MNVPKLPSVFKKHTYRESKKFNYQPLYYNEAKERLAEQVANAKKEAALEEKMGTKHLSFTKGIGQYRANQNSSSNFRLVIILGILALIAYWLLK